MTQQNNEAFKKFISELDFQDIAHDTESIRQLYWRAWQAAKADSEREIAIALAQLDRLISRNDELQAHINVLREALENLKQAPNHMIPLPQPNMEVSDTWPRFTTTHEQIINEALASTPAQPLIEKELNHDTTK